MLEPKIYSVRYAKNNFSKLLIESETEGMVLIRKYSEVCAAIVPMTTAGLHKFFSQLLEAVNQADESEYPDGYREARYAYKNLILPNIIDGLNEAMVNEKKFKKPLH